jgi:hypothetical protein
MSGSWGAQLIGGMQPQAGGGSPINVGGTASGSLVDCPGGLCVMTAAASAWNGATVTLQLLGPDGSSLLTVSVQTTLSANGVGSVNLPPCQIQATVTGGPPTGLFVSIARVVN